MIPASGRWFCAETVLTAAAVTLPPVAVEAPLGVAPLLTAVARGIQGAAGTRTAGRSAGLVRLGAGRRNAELRRLAGLVAFLSVADERIHRRDIVR